MRGWVDTLRLVSWFRAHRKPFWCFGETARLVEILDVEVAGERVLVCTATPGSLVVDRGAHDLPTQDDAVLGAL